MSLNDVMSSDEFQNRFGVHTKPFQEFAAYILIMSREYTDLSVREVGEYVKNLMQEKHKLELDLADAKTETKHQKWSNTVPIPRWSFGDRPNDVRASQSEGFYEDPNGPWVQYKDIRYSNSVVQAAVIAGQADEIKRLKQENDTLASCLSRDQGALRNVGFELDGDVWKPPVLAVEAMRLKHELQEAKADAEKAKAERNKLSNEYREIQILEDMKDRFYAVMKELLRGHSMADVEADAYIHGRCDPVARAKAIKDDSVRFQIIRAQVES